jgi:hypothetical protein
MDRCCTLLTNPSGAFKRAHAHFDALAREVSCGRLIPLTLERATTRVRGAVTCSISEMLSCVPVLLCQRIASALANQVQLCHQVSPAADARTC